MGILERLFGRKKEQGGTGEVAAECRRVREQLGVAREELARHQAQTKRAIASARREAALASLELESSRRQLEVLRAARERMASATLSPPVRIPTVVVSAGVSLALHGWLLAVLSVSA